MWSRCNCCLIMWRNICLQISVNNLNHYNRVLRGACRYRDLSWGFEDGIYSIWPLFTYLNACYYPTYSLFPGFIICKIRIRLASVAGEQKKGNKIYLVHDNVVLKWMIHELFYFSVSIKVEGRKENNIYLPFVFKIIFNTK